MVLGDESGIYMLTSLFLIFQKCRIFLTSVSSLDLETIVQTSQMICNEVSRQNHVGYILRLMLNID